MHRCVDSDSRSKVFPVVVELLIDEPIFLCYYTLISYNLWHAWNICKLRSLISKDVINEMKVTIINFFLSKVMVGMNICKPVHEIIADVVLELIPEGSR